eukprot:Awhi_evm1s10639
MVKPFKSGSALLEKWRNNKKVQPVVPTQKLDEVVNKEVEKVASVTSNKQASPEGALTDFEIKLNRHKAFPHSKDDLLSRASFEELLSDNESYRYFFDFLKKQHASENAEFLSKALEYNLSTANTDKLIDNNIDDGDYTKDSNNPTNENNVDNDNNNDNNNNNNNNNVNKSVLPNDNNIFFTNTCNENGGTNFDFQKASLKERAQYITDRFVRLTSCQAINISNDCRVHILEKLEHSELE